MWILEFEPELGQQHRLSSIKVTGNTLQELLQNAKKTDDLGLYKSELDTGLYVGKIYYYDEKEVS